MATGTPDSQARFGQSVKGLLTEKVTTCGTDVIALTKQVLKGSRSSEVKNKQNGISSDPAILLLGISQREVKTGYKKQPYEEGAYIYGNTIEVTDLLLGQAARNMVLQEDAILHSEDSLRKMAIITTHLQYQQEAIQKNVGQSSDLQDQLNHLLK